MRNFFQAKAVEKIKTHIWCSIIFFRKSCNLRDIARQATAGNMAHAQCNTQGHKHALRTCDTAFPIQLFVLPLPYFVE